MKLNRIIAYLIGCLVLASSFFVYIEYIHLLGFPDGFITELEYAERKLAYLLIAIDIIFGSWFIYLGKLASKKKISKKLSTAIFLYLIFLVSIFFVDRYYKLHLVNSAGG